MKPRYSRFTPISVGGTDVYNFYVGQWVNPPYRLWRFRWRQVLAKWLFKLPVLRRMATFYSVVALDADKGEITVRRSNWDWRSFRQTCKWAGR